MSAEVRKGQLWADNDKRCPTRRLRIHDVTATHAIAYAWDENSTEGKTTRIRLDRFKPTSTGSVPLAVFLGRLIAFGRWAEPDYGDYLRALKEVGRR